MPTVLITGGTGMIGKALSRALLEKGYHVVVLSRTGLETRYAIRNTGLTNKTLENHGSRISHPASLKYAHWNIETNQIDNDAIATADHIIHLAGASVADKRWTKKRKQEIRDSRVKSGKLLVNSLKNIPNRVKSVISISGIGYYGPDNSDRNAFKEADAPYNDFLAQVCQQWESTMQPVTGLGKRLVILRTGVVLSSEGGALKEFLKPLKFGFATILGSGKQIISWIHIEDLVKLFISAIENENYSGVYNAVAPNPVSNRKFVLEMARIKKKFFIPVHVSSFVLRTVLGEMSVEVLKSAKVSSKKIENNGFSFHFPVIKSALNDLLKKDPGPNPG